MSSTIRIKRSSVAGKSPNTENLSTGELALNIADGRLFSSNGESVFEIGSITKSGEYNELDDTLVFTRADDSTYSIDLEPFIATFGTTSPNLTSLSSNTDVTIDDNGKSYFIEDTDVVLTLDDTDNIPEGLQFSVYTNGIPTTINLPEGALFVNRGILPSSEISSFSNKQIQEYANAQIDGGSNTITTDPKVDKAAITYHGNNVFTIIEDVRPDLVTPPEVSELFDSVALTGNTLLFGTAGIGTESVDLTSIIPANTSVTSGTISNNFITFTRADSSTFNVDINDLVKQNQISDFVSSSEISDFVSSSEIADFVSSSEIADFITANTNATLNTLTLNGELRGPANFVIDPAAHGDDTGTLVIRGNLQVDGTTTTINSTTLQVDDKTLELAANANNATQADGAGVIVLGANAQFTYAQSTDSWNANKPLSGTYKNLHAEVSAITTEIDFDKPIMTLSMSGNVTFTEANKAEGKSVMLKLSRGSHTPTFSSNIKWPDNEAPTWSDYSYWVITFLAHDSTTVFASAQGYSI